MWDKHFNRPPCRRSPKLVRMGSQEAVCERIITAYIETGRSVRSLASYYGVSKSTIGRYIKDYAAELMPFYVYQNARKQAKWNRSHGAIDTSEVGSLD